MPPIVNNKFIVISAVFNTAPYIEQCVKSLMCQTYKNYEYMLVEDFSTDGTRHKVRKLQEEYGFNVHYNDYRRESPLENFVRGIQFSPGDPEDIIVTLDGDDWLYDEDVLLYLNSVYQDRMVWMTYGSFISASGNIKDMCRPLTNTRDYRKRTTWVTSHIRTIKRKLFDKIKDADLRDGNGKYYVYYPETAYMFPAIEMSGLQHCRFLDKLLYVYNDLSPLCSADDWKTKPERQKEIYKIAREIRMKPLYEELTEL